VPPPEVRQRHLSISKRVVLWKQASFHGADAKRRTRRKRSRREEDSRRNPWAWGASPAHSPSSTRQRRLLPAPAKRARKATRQKQETNDAAAFRTLSEEKVPKEDSGFPEREFPLDRQRCPEFSCRRRQRGITGPWRGPSPNVASCADPVAQPTPYDLRRSRWESTTQAPQVRHPIALHPEWDGGCGLALRKHQKAPTSPVSSWVSFTGDDHGFRIEDRSGTPFHVGAAPPLAG